MLAALAAIVGPAHVLAGTDAAFALLDHRGVFRGHGLAVVRPGSTSEVAQVVALCARHRVPIVPQGGNTGLVGGATPDSSGQAVVLVLSRLNRVRQVDAENDSITVEAGCVLADVQATARDAGRLFPLSLGSEGSCTIGGNLATNAGGTQVLRYGNARALALGLEVVTPTGDVWDGLRGLRKDNTGYDLRDLYIGSEGTLGIITAATLRLFPLPAAEKAAFIAFPSAVAAVAFLAAARAGFGAALTGFELISGPLLDLVARHQPEAVLPYGAAERSAPWHALIEISGSDTDAHATSRLEAVLAAAIERGEVIHAVIAAHARQAQALWALRHRIIGETLRREGGSVSHDISLPISRIAAFLADIEEALRRLLPGTVVYPYGHLGDGNLHYNVIPPQHAPAEVRPQIRRLVYDAVVAGGGSFGAEHGIGQSKPAELARYKSALELRLMRAIKAALDPHDLMNPGKALPPEAVPPAR